MKLYSRMFAVNVQSVSVQQLNWDSIIQYIRNTNSFPVVCVIDCTNVRVTLRYTSRNVQWNMVWLVLCCSDIGLITCSCITCLIFTARCYASAVLAMGLCLCTSARSRCSTKTAKRRITQTTPHDTTGYSFLVPEISAKFDRGYPLRGRQMQVGCVKIGDFRQITGYISKTVKDRRKVSIKVE